MSTMIDEPDPQDADPAETPPREVPRTGDPAVDEVLDELAGLADLPLEEHVPVFERAHEKLRSALDGPRDS